MTVKGIASFFLLMLATLAMARPTDIQIKANIPTDNPCPGNLVVVLDLFGKDLREIKGLRCILDKAVDNTGKRTASGAGINEGVTWKGIMECWNLGILEEDSLGRDERLLVQGTQTRLRYSYGVAGACPSQNRYSVSPIIPTFPYSNIPGEVIGKIL